MKVGIFYSSIVNADRFPNKVQLMNNFKLGVEALGDTAITYKDSSLSVADLDAGFILGYTFEQNFRKKIIDTLTSFNIPRIFVDSNILQYAKENNHWHRYSINSVHPDTGTYFFNKLDPQKWSTFSNWHNVSLKPWRTHGEHILINAQRPKGFNMFTNQELWLSNVIEHVAETTNRQIIIRPHPGDKTSIKWLSKIKSKYSFIKISSNKHIQNDLTNCWCSINYTSTPSVVSAIEGIPVYVEESKKSWAQDICFEDLKQLENPPIFDRLNWIHKIANIHWNEDEVRSGKLWSAIKTYISAARQ